MTGGRREINAGTVDRALAALKEMQSLGIGADVLEAVVAFGTKRQEVSDRLGYVQFAIRDLILLKKDEHAPLCFFEERDYAAELATHYTLDALFLLYDAIGKALDDLERNANVRLTLTSMMQNAGLI